MPRDRARSHASPRQRLALGLAVLVGVPALSLAPPSYADPGDPVPAFDGDGLWEDPVLGSAPGVVGLALDGSALVYFGPTAGPPSATKSSLRRLQPDGSPDTTFSSDGVLEFDATTNASSFEWPKAVAIDADGRYVTLTGMFDGTDYGFHVRRYTDTANLNGVVTSTIPSPDLQPNLPRSLATDTTASRKILVAGSSNIDASMIVTRLQGSGSLVPDPAFGAGGTVSLNPEGGSHDSDAHAVVVDGSGRILLAGSSYVPGSEGSFSGTWILVRLTSAGEPDPTFSGDGVLMLDPPQGFGSPQALALDPRGRILAAGMSQPCGLPPSPPATDTCSPAQRPQLARFLPTGRLDRTFGNDGWAMLPSALAGARGDFQTVAVDPRGWVLAGGSTGFSTTVARFSPEGRPDPTFGTGGAFVYDPYPTAGDEAPHGGTYGLVVDGSTVVAAGYARAFAGYHWAAQRLDGSGTPPVPTGTITRPGATVTRLKGKAGPGAKVSRVDVAVQKVDKPLLRTRHQCRWAVGTKPRFAISPATRHAGRWTCSPPDNRWRRAQGKASWRLTWTKALPNGTYAASLRVTLTTGAVKVAATRTFSG